MTEREPEHEPDRRDPLHEVELDGSDDAGDRVDADRELDRNERSGGRATSVALAFRAGRDRSCERGRAEHDREHQPLVGVGRSETGWYTTRSMSVAWSAVLVSPAENGCGVPGRMKKRASRVRFPSRLVNCSIRGGSHTTK